MWIILGVLNGGEQARSCALIMMVRMKMSGQNVRANLGPLQFEYEVRCLAAARPRLEEARHEGQYLGNRAQ
jgi:hypothetical protein